MLVDPELGRLSLHPEDEGRSVETGFALTQPFDIGGGAYDRRPSLEKWLPDFIPKGEDPPWQIGVSRIDGQATENDFEGGPVVASLQAAVDRWNDESVQGSRGIIVVMDNASYPEPINATHAIKLKQGAKLAIVAAAWPAEPTGGGIARKPGQLSPMHRRAVILNSVMVEADDAGNGEGATLVLDGLVIEGNLGLRDSGDLGALRLYNCTLGTKGETLGRALQAAGGNTRLSLVLDRCIAAKVDLQTATGPAEVTRSIIGEDRIAGGGGAGAGSLNLRVPLMDLRISGSTVFGRTTCRSLSAGNSILTGRVAVEHRQSGCVRFCSVDPDSALPRRFRCVPSAGDDPAPRPVFVSTRFADPGFGMLSLSTPVAISEGAEDGMEMGVGHANRDPARRANIRDAMEEFSPFGLVPGLIYVT